MTSSLRRVLIACSVAIVSLASFPRTLLAVAPVLADFDGDGDCDNFDLHIVLNSQGTVSGGNAFIGDADGDGDVDGGDYAIAKSEFDASLAGGNSVPMTVPAPNAAKLLYNPANGALLLDQANAAGGKLTSFILQSTAFNTVNPISYPFPPNLSPPVNLATRTATIVAQSDPNAVPGVPTGLPSNPFNLGNLLPTGLNLAGLQGLSLRGEYLGQIEGAFGLRRHNFQLQVIPEPTGASLAIVVMVMFGVRRRGGQ